MNSLGNRHIGSNLRILLINNGCGTEFRKNDHPCAVFGDEADRFMAAAGHFGSQSKTLVKDFVRNLGFKYMSASSKEEFLEVYEEFSTSQKGYEPIVFEVFTKPHDESSAIDAYRHIVTDFVADVKNKINC